MTSNKVRWTTISAALVLGLCAGYARAQDARPALGGPKVTDSGVPGEARSFGDAKGEKKKDMARPIPHVAFMRALHVVRGEEAGKLALTSEQDAQVRAIDQDFQGEVAKFREAHQGEAKDLMKDLSPEDRRQAMQMLGRARGELGVRGEKGEKGRRRPEGGPPAPPPGDEMMQEPGAKPDPANAEAAKEKLKALFDAAPKPMDAHARIFAVLNADQKSAVETELARVREEMQKQAKDRMAERLKDTNKVKGLKGKAPEGGPDRDAVRQAMQGLSPEEREKVRQMSPEDRRAYIRNLIQQKGGQK